MVGGNLTEGDHVICIPLFVESYRNKKETQIVLGSNMKTDVSDRKEIEIGT